MGLKLKRKQKFKLTWLKKNHTKIFMAIWFNSYFTDCFPGCMGKK